MSGIFGIVYHSDMGNSIKEDVKKIYAWNSAYGKEKESLYIRNTAVLGCCYEHLNSKALQSEPVLEKENRFAVIDALIYNSQELLEKCGLQHDMPEEELLFYYLNTFGIDALKKVNGDFSGGLYNEKENTLTLFRDHMGIRPLFYFADSCCVAFSTDIRGLLALKMVDSSINEEWVYRMCSGYYMDGLTWTEFENIHCVNPASSITFSFQNGNIKRTESTYWHPGSQKIRYSSFQEYKNKLRELVTDSIKRRLDVAPGIVGAELSGGLDSGVIDILIHRLKRECLYDSWSVDPGQLPYTEDDERLIIADICKQEDITCHFRDLKLDFSLKCNLANNIKETGVPLDEREMPFLRYVMPPYVNTLSPSATSEYMEKNGARVVFSGHGGDEGVSHRCNLYELFYHHEYYHFFKQVWYNTAGKKRRLIKTAKKSYQILSEVKRQLYAPFHGSGDVRELLNHDFAIKYSEKNMPMLHFAFSPIEYIKEGGSRNRLDNVALLGAYNGVRYLLPYLDYRLVDFAVSIPRYLYLSKGTNRFIFREAFKDIMPNSLYQLQTKETNSTKNLPLNPDWFQEFQKEKVSVVQKLDRNFWSKYLDFRVIDAWMKKDKPRDEEIYHDDNILRCLLNCAMAQNLIEKSKLAVKDLK